MANRYFTQFPKTLEKEVVMLFARVSFGAAGAPTLDATNSKGIVSVTRNGAGVFTVVLGTKVGMLDVYPRLLGAQVVFNTVGTGNAPAAPLLEVSADAVATAGSASLQLTFRNAAGTATDPASGEVALIELKLKNSTAQ